MEKLKKVSPFLAPNMAKLNYHFLDHKYHHGIGYNPKKIFAAIPNQYHQLLTQMKRFIDLSFVTTNSKCNIVVKLYLFGKHSPVLHSVYLCVKCDIQSGFTQ